MLPLDGPRLKVRRAESEIQALREAENVFRKNSDYRVVMAEVNPKTGNDVYRVRISSPPPSLEWGIHVGEIAHNLRSALDGLVYQLALLRTDTPATNTQFPIFLVGRTKRRKNGRIIPHFEAMRGKRGKKSMELGNGRSMIRQLLPKHQALIERLQPYKRGRGDRNCPLWWLHEVNNADKHRLIQVVAAKTGAGPFVGGLGDDFKYPFSIRPGMILKDGAIFGEAPHGVHVNPKLIPLIAFWEGCPQVKGKAVANTLRIITEDVSKILEGFAPEFSVIS